MAIKNIKQLLVSATQLPAAIEDMLPAGAPKISQKLVDAANKVPEGPGFPIELPDLPKPPKFTKPSGGALGLGGNYVREVQITPAERVVNRPLSGTILS